MKGAVLAGGLGTRLHPLTKVTNKHLLPVWSKPMIYYPIEVLVGAGIDDIMVVTGGESAGDFLKLLGNGKEFGLRHLNYTYQEGEGGIADAVRLCEHFAEGDRLVVILGDNILEKSIKPYVEEFARQEKGAKVLLKEVKNVQDPNFTDLAKQVTVEEPIRYTVGGNKLAVVIDCGVKYGILRNLLRRGFDVVRVPYVYSAEQILDLKPDGVMISNGPGDPKQCVKTVEAVRELLDKGMPMMGVCLGTQILALAVGGDTYKLKYGHRSQNQPALDLETGRCYITTQNHGYTVERDSIKDTGLKEWFMNANDKTVEGVKHKSKPVFAVQWHPEASPGPYDTEFLFDSFAKTLEAA